MGARRARRVTPENGNYLVPPERDCNNRRTTVMTEVDGGKPLQSQVRKLAALHGARIMRNLCPCCEPARCSSSSQFFLGSAY